MRIDCGYYDECDYDDTRNSRGSTESERRERDRSHYREWALVVVMC